MEGPLSKWTNVMKGWQYRWFVLDDNAGLLSYYTSKDKMVRGARRGCVRLKGAVVGIDDEDDSTFTVTVDGKMFHFQARDGDERERWLRALENTTRRHTSSSSFGYKWSSPLHPPTLQDFDRKLTESDAYLQLLIEQIKDLETKLENAEDALEKNNMKRVLEKANAVLEMIKHSIVLLQIAKNTTNPVNGVYQPFVETPSLTVTQQNNRGETESNENENIPGNPTSRSNETFQNDTSSYLSAHESIHNPGGLQNLSSFVSNISGPPSGSLDLIVPETSYSSSDDDEDFYDANDEVSGGSIQSPNNSRLIEKAIESLQEDNLHRNLQSEPSGQINYDALYECGDEEDLGSVEGQGSVISHLLSQVKIGMDLTKVVLPTFILERRSLLEMYADFFAHPDIFVSIPDFEDPKDRMVQVLRWYLSAFHAGRKSSVAKKPYNPILGEVFKCYWDLNSPDPDKSNVPEGPVPWASKNNLTFIAEQVSHHPPISAFYAEHYNKGIIATAHIWTKSKFLGLSIGVHNVGQGIVSVLKYDEDYIITFPNGYGRSILTVPWIELGGQVSITCAKTGYYANIEFLTKPFYGGKRHRITADVFQPNEKKSFLTITGEWNGVMHEKLPNGQTEVFIDTRSIPIIKKVVKPIAEQEPYESRKLWKDVTVALHYRHVKAATDNKYFLEQKQRDEARERKETNTTWENRVFHKVGENWTYDSPLPSRQKESNKSIT